MKLINFYKNIWMRPVSLKDRLLFCLMIVLASGLYLYSKLDALSQSLNEHLFEFICILGLILLIAFIRPVGKFIIRLWLSVSGTIGQVVFMALLFIVFYVFLSPVYILFNLIKKKDLRMSSNWSTGSHKNSNYKSPG